MPTRRSRWRWRPSPYDYRMGEATSRTEVNRTTYSTLLVGVLELFKTVVQPAIPGEAREMVSREFADGVNAITGKVLGDAKTAA